MLQQLCPPTEGLVPWQEGRKGRREKRKWWDFCPLNCYFVEKRVFTRPSRKEEGKETRKGERGCISGA